MADMAFVLAFVLAPILGMGAVISAVALKVERRFGELWTLVFFIGASVAGAMLLAKALSLLGYYCEV